MKPDHIEFQGLFQGNARLGGDGWQAGSVKDTVAENPLNQEEMDVQRHKSSCSLSWFSDEPANEDQVVEWFSTPIKLA